jgi:hypothetical protein
MGAAVVEGIVFPGDIEEADGTAVNLDDPSFAWL